MRTIAFFFVLSILLANRAYSFTIKNPFKKTPAPQKEKMVETKQEWEQKAKNVPLEDRTIEPYTPPKSDKNITYPDPHFVFELYNSPPGMREINIDDVKRNLYSYPYIVSDNKCHYAAYPRYYFSPDNNQISSEFFVEELDTSKTKVQRMLDYNHNQKVRNSIIISGKKEHYQHLFSGLSLVDWSKDGKRLLIKERVGSTVEGVYKTYLYVHFMGNDVTRGYTIKLENFDNAIKRYYTNYRDLNIIEYRYDIFPLGFSQDNDDIIVTLVYVYDKNNKKIFLGTWGYNTSTNESMLFSTTNNQVSVSANGLILTKVLE